MTAPLRRNGRSTDQIARMCESKRRYPDELTCCAAGMHFIELGQKKDLWRYRCRLCDGWHLTSADNGWHNHVSRINRRS